MATPNVDEIWADYNPDGSVHEPNKVDVRRWGRFLEAIATASGMETYPNRAAMDADLTQIDGTPALLWSDPTPANNFPTVWVYNDSLNQWIAGTDRIESLKATVGLIHNIMRRVVVLGSEGVIDRLGLLGGGVGQIYIPRNIFVDIPGQAASNITVANANSTEKPGWAKLAIPAGVRCFVYLDRSDNTYKVIGATAGEFTLPTTAADMVVPIIDFPTPGLSGWWSPYRFRELSPLSALSTFVSAFPLVHDRAANKLLIPSFTVRSEGTLYTHAVAATDRYEEYSLGSTGTAAITYWYKFSTNTIEATAAGGTPFTVDPTLGLMIGWSWANEFYSPWPHIGRMSEALGKNDFAYGKGNRLLLSPSVWEGEITNLAMVDVADSALIALGFTRALRTTNAAATWPYIGDKIPDNRAGKTFFARIWLEATVDNDFGAARAVRLVKADGIGQSIQFILEKTLSARAAIYSVAAPMPDWTANTPLSGEYVFVQVGVSTPGGTNEVRIAGAQFAFGQNAQWIERNDFPSTASTAIRVFNLEAAAAETDPVPSILYGRDMWLINGRDQSLHIDNLFETRTERKGTLTTLFAPSPDIANTAAKPYEMTLEAGSYVIDPAKIGNLANIWAKRYSDTNGSAANGRSYRSAAITVHKASSSGKNGAVTPGSNTGNGTLVQGVPFVDPTAPIGNYTITVQAGAETFEITGPSSFKSRGVIGVAFDGPLNFTLNSGSTVFISGDSWTVAVTGDTVRVMGIGDSIMSQTLSTYVRDILTARGMTVTMSGTIGPTGNEGRPGSTFTDHIYARSGWLTPVTNWATYLAALPAVKQTLDPFTRGATGGDPPGSVYGGRIFDFGYYLANSGVLPPTHVWICLGTNDIATYAAATAADWIEKALTIMVGSIRAAVPTAKITIGLPTLPRTATADARWNASYGLAIRKILDFVDTLAEPLVTTIPIWAHINQVTGFSNSEVVVSTDADTGMQTLDNGDMLHPSPAGVHQYAEVVAAWVANTFDGT